MSKDKKTKAAAPTKPPADELPDEIKRFIVTSLACWETPSEVAKAVKDAHQIELSRQRVQAYDPSKVAGKGLSKEWRELFHSTREAYLKSEADIGIAQKTHRLWMLDRMASQAETRGNFVLAASLIEQAAKETGGAFTNRRELSGPNGAPIQTQARVILVPPKETPDRG